MARPIKCRRIENIPVVPYFVPSEKDVDGVSQNTLKLEELEAIRLKDLEGFEQSECAEKMGISRPTFQRILLSAREKVADSLVNGKAIRIEGGNFTLNIHPVKCLNCSNEWMENHENLETIPNGNFVCPACGSNSIACDKGHKGKWHRRKGHRHGRKDR
ncbi:MAG TPA: DUF134 domain-containing protein [Clostridiales bacterium]|nr:DUF134 domain-containing protein [Clostridiales bacterium]